MIRAAFSALGINLTLWGAGLFYVETVTLRPDTPRSWLLAMVSNESANSLLIHLAPWVPYTLIGVGVVTILYAIALPRAAMH